MRITYFALCLCLVNLIQSAKAQPTTEVAPLKSTLQPAFIPNDNDTLKQVVESFVNVLNRASSNQDHSFFDLLPYVSGGKVGYYGGQEFLEEWQKRRGKAFLELAKFEIIELKGNDAKVKVTYIWNAATLKSAPFEETLTFHLTQAWRIVPNLPLTAEATIRFAPDLPVLGPVAQSLVTPEQSVTALHMGQTLTNLRMLYAGTFAFTQDYDETFAFAPQYAQQALKPYLNRDLANTPDLWEVPGHPSETYTFNSNLSGRSSSPTQAYMSPDLAAHMVLIYEGKNEQPVFRYNGKAAIAFADGHITLVAPDEMKSLIWKP